MLWAALHAAKLGSAAGPKKWETRVRKGLAFKRQVDHAVKWLDHLVQAKGSFLDGHPMVPLSKVFRFRSHAPIVGVTTDACPTGLGGILNIGGKPVAYFALEVTTELCKIFGDTAKVGDPSFQTEWELLAIFIAVKVFAKFLRKIRVQIFLKTDNTAALRAALEFKASSPIMCSLAAEISIQLEADGWDPLWGRHLRGIHNTLADSLSRMFEGESLPEILVNVRRVEVPPVLSLFKVWPRAVT